VPTEVSVQVTAEVARVFHRRGAPTPDSTEIETKIASLGFALQPLHPGGDPPELATYFYVEVPTAADADRLVAELSSCHGIRAAYVKPPAEAP